MGNLWNYFNFLKIDKCNRIWILDTGKNVYERLCQPQLLSFSLKTNKLLSRYRFPDDQSTNASFFITPVVDIRKTGSRCADTFIYIADVAGFQLIVYDHRHQRSWNIKNNLFYPYPTAGIFNIGSQTFDLMDGILGLALGPITPHGNDRMLYFHSLASRVESYVPTSIIR